ncbi:MAG: aspartate carbamoyltransferase [Methylococcaceae bacterium]
MKPQLTLAAVLIASLTTISAQAVEKASEKRLDEVVERGSHVMPFDLEQTTHIFSKTAQGGLQQVVVKDKTNTAQIKLIREHLTKISTEFKNGDFSNPAKIHGKDMPGLEELRTSKPEQLKIDYQELPDGAQINYASNEKKVIDAIHQFFDAQLSDHARHAISGHEDHSMHRQ